MGRITTHGDGGKAYTAEGTACPKAMGKENMGKCLENSQQLT